MTNSKLRDVLKCISYPKENSSSFHSNCYFDKKKHTEDQPHHYFLVCFLSLNLIFDFIKTEADSFQPQSWFESLQGVKIYDTKQQRRITHVSRTNSEVISESYRVELYPAHITWKDDRTVMIGWANDIKVSLSCDLEIALLVL